MIPDRRLLKYLLTEPWPRCAIDRLSSMIRVVVVDDDKDEFGIACCFSPWLPVASKPNV